MKTLSIDIETYSIVDLAKCGVYKYTEASDFDILLFGYSVDGGPVQVVVCLMMIISSRCVMNWLWWQRS